MVLYGLCNVMGSVWYLINKSDLCLGPITSIVSRKIGICINVI